MPRKKSPVPKVKCRGKSRQTKEPCKLDAIPGGVVCRHHGGSAPQVKEAAARRVATIVAEKEAAAAIAHVGLEPVQDPLQALGKLTQSVEVMMESLGRRVNSLDEIDTYDKAGAQRLQVTIELYERAQDRLGKFLDMMIRHGYAERQVTLQEQEALVVSGIIRRVIAGLGLTPEQQQNAQKLLAKEFRALEKAAE
ncbi:MAG: hypothetical protein ABS888_00105 [Eubacteriales bacterium]